MHGVGKIQAHRKDVKSAEKNHLPNKFFLSHTPQPWADAHRATEPNKKAHPKMGFYKVLTREALIKLLRGQILNLRCSLYSRTGALLDSNFGRSLHLIRASLDRSHLPSKCCRIFTARGTCTASVINYFGIHGFTCCTSIGVGDGVHCARAGRT